MWTAQFVALSGDPSLGFQFPPPENVIFGEPTRLATQGSLPSTELVERAGFTGITENPDPFGPRHFPFDDDQGPPLPALDEAGFYNYPIQAAMDARFNAIPAYLERFGAVFNGSGPLPAGGITISMRRRESAEFQTRLTAPPSHPPGHGRSALHA